MASSTTITYPSELTSSNAYVQYVIDGSRPAFTTFGAFTTDTGCAVTAVLIYADTSKTAHSTLELASSGSTYTPQVISSANFQTETDYTFSLLIILSSGISESWASVSCASGTCTTFTLNTYINCNTYLSFSSYSSSYSQSLSQGAAGSVSWINSAGTQYVSTSDSSLCPISSYSKTVSSGTSSDVNLHANDGSLSIGTGTAQTIQFTITVCAKSSTDASDCITSAQLEFVISSGGCASSLSESGWSTYAPSNPIEIGAASSTIEIQSLGTNYIQTSDSSGCPITSYSLTETSSTGSGGTITQDSSTG